MQKTAYDDLESALNGSHEHLMEGRTPLKGAIGNSGGRPQTSQGSSGNK